MTFGSFFATGLNDAVSTAELFWPFDELLENQFLDVICHGMEFWGNCTITMPINISSTVSLLMELPAG